MTLANAMILVDQTAVPLTLPAIMADFHVQSQTVQWVLNGSLLPLAGLLVFGGRLGDLLGRRRIFLIGSVMFAGASALVVSRRRFPLLLAARVAQGVGGALMLPGSVAIVSAAFPPDKPGSALGTMGGVAAVAGALGPTIGGVLDTAVSWRAVLLVNVPLAVACVILTLRAVPTTRRARAPAHRHLRHGPAVRHAGRARLRAVPDPGRDHHRTGGPAPAGLAVVAGVLFVARERRATNPLLSLSMLRSRATTWARRSAKPWPGWPRWASACCSPCC